MFNILVGSAIGIILLLPIFWIKNKWGRYAIGALAVVGVALGVQLSEVYLSPTYTSWRFERDIKQQPLFQTIAKYHPQEFQNYLQQAETLIKQRGNLNLIPVYSSQLVDKVFYPHLQNAPDENVALYLRATLDLYHYLCSKDPRMILKMEGKNSAEPLDITVFAEDKEFQTLLNRLIDTKRFLIEAAIKTPVPPPSKEQAAPLLDEILNRLANQYGNDAVKLMFAPPELTVPANVVAKLFIELYSQILLAGTDKAGIMMRHIGNLKAQALAAASMPEMPKPVLAPPQPTLTPAPPPASDVGPATAPASGNVEHH